METTDKKLIDQAAEQEAPKAEQTAPEVNQTTPEAEQSTPEVNQTTPEAEQSTPETDQGGSVVDQAVEKLSAMLAGTKKNDLVKPVLEHLIERCRESASLSEDVIREGRDKDGLYNYIMDRAKKRLSGKSGYVPPDVVYEWGEDYFHLSDEELKETKKTPAKKYDAKKAAEKATADKKATADTKAAPEKKPEPKQEAPRKKSKDIEGQLDLFSMMEG